MVLGEFGGYGFNGKAGCGDRMSQLPGEMKKPRLAWGGLGLELAALNLGLNYFQADKH